MNHGFKLHPDGTLEITMPKGVKVGRVLVCEEGAQDGALYYREGDVPNTNDGDTISRQEMLRAFEEMCSCTDYEWDERDFRDLIKKIPSVELDVPDINVGDMISRQDAIDAVKFGITYVKAVDKNTGKVINLFEEINKELKKAEERIKKLPSAEPERKKGKWIKDRDVIYHCSCCGTDYLMYELAVKDTHYCPNCGSKMER